MVKHHLLSFLLILLWIKEKGKTNGAVVTQTDFLWKNEGEDATMNCSHTKDITYDQMYWYRQLPGETMRLIVFTRNRIDNHDFGDFKEEKFSATKPNPESGTFTVKHVTAADKALYFCAVSQHSESVKDKTSTKT